MSLSTTTRVEKPWGHETIWAKTERYVGKILHLRAGESLSLQYHRVKEETIRVLAGRLRLESAKERGPATCGCSGRAMGHTSRPASVTAWTALEDTDVLEVSTPELDDVVRLEDRYGRVEEGSER